MVFDDPLANGKTEPCPLLLGGEEGNEDVQLLFGRNARSGVRDLNLDHLDGAEITEPFRPQGPDSDLAARRSNSLERVLDEVDQNLLELLGVRGDFSEPPAQLQLEL